MEANQGSRRGRPAGRRRSNAGYTVKREAILNTAAALFAQRGYERASLNDLADLLHITKPTLYYYYGSKDQLLLAIKTRAQDQILDVVEDLVAAPGTGADKLRRALLTYARVMTSDTGKCLAMTSRVELDPTAQAEFQSRVERGNRALLALLEQAGADGSLVYRDRTVAFFTLFGSLNWTGYWFNPAGRLDGEAVAEIQVDTLLDGLRPR